MGDLQRLAKETHRSPFFFLRLGSQTLLVSMFKLRDILHDHGLTVRPGKSVRPIAVLRWGWWAVYEHGRLSWAQPSWLLIDWKKPSPSWILKPIAHIVLQAIAYCFSPLLIGYWSFERPIVLSRKMQIMWTKRRAKHAAAGEGKPAKDWELPDSRIWLAEIDIDRG